MKHTIEHLKQIVETITTPIIAILGTVFGFKTILIILSGESKADKDIQIYILGFLTSGILGLILAFYFAGNNRKRGEDRKRGMMG